MKKTIGIVLAIIGIAGTILTGVNAAQSTEKINFFGNTLTVSQADWTPVVISVLILIAGVVLLLFNQKKG